MLKLSCAAVCRVLIILLAHTHTNRGLNVEGESESWDFGVGAGFYINATVDKWKNWRMYDYITKVCLHVCVGGGLEFPVAPVLLIRESLMAWPWHVLISWGMGSY